MKNVKLFVKFRRIAKSFSATIIIIFLGMIGSAFKSAEGNIKTRKTSSAEEAQADKYGFKSLFDNNIFDPSQPYTPQLNPKAVPFVQSYIRECGANLEKMKIWGKPYFDMYDAILSTHGLPKELKYLSVIESDLVSNAVSVAGAVGPWQIMSSEALRMGLKVNARVDERKNFAKSTHAAAKILKELYSQFKDWTLVIAAYNCGAGRVRQAIRKSGSKNFWELQAYLPAETRNHVKRFIGTHYIFEGSGGLTTMTADEIQDLNLNDIKKQEFLLVEEGISTLEISGKYCSKIVSKNLGMDVSQFQKLNPNFDKLILAGNTYTMHLPADKIVLFTSKKNTILSESVQFLLNGEAVSS